MTIPAHLRDEHSRRQLTEQLKHVIEGGGVPRDQALPSRPLTEPPEPGIGFPRDRALTGVLAPAGFLDIHPSPAARAIEDLKRSGYRPLGSSFGGRGDFGSG
jgi:hypothetical protein